MTALYRAVENGEAYTVRLLLETGQYNDLETELYCLDK